MIIIFFCDPTMAAELSQYSMNIQLINNDRSIDVNNIFGTPQSFLPPEAQIGPDLDPILYSGGYIYRTDRNNNNNIENNEEETNKKTSTSKKKISQFRRFKRRYRLRTRRFR